MMLSINRGIYLIIEPKARKQSFTGSENADIKDSNITLKAQAKPRRLHLSTERGRTMNSIRTEVKR